MGLTVSREKKRVVTRSKDKDCGVAERVTGTGNGGGREGQKGGTRFERQEWGV